MAVDSSNRANAPVSEAWERPLRILIVGAGIGGFTAAIALRQQGHDVEIFEQSRLSQENGAAIHFTPNANGLLRRLGLYAEDIGAVECTHVTDYFPYDGKVKYSVHAKPTSDKLWAHPWHLAHRPHLHTKFKQMVTDESGKGQPAKLHLSRRVKSVDPAAATITFEDGTHATGDLVVGADGVHSKTRASIPGCDKKPFDTGKSAFRFLIPTQQLLSDPATVEIVKPNQMVMWIAEDRRLVMYPCANNELMNFVAVHPGKESDAGTNGEDWQEMGSKAQMLKIFGNWHPSVIAILEKAVEPKIWKLLDMEKLPTFVHERLALLGDAAHPFLPYQAQGGAQAIEDALALAVVLPLGTAPHDVKERLELYEQCRYERAHKIQNSTRITGKDTTELGRTAMRVDMTEYRMYNLGHDAWDHATNVLRKHLEHKDPTLRYRSPLGFGPSPGPRRPLGLHPSHPTVQSLRRAAPEQFTTYSIKIVTSRTYLQNMLPPGFSFTSPATKAYASVTCTTLDSMTWLGGKSHNHCGLYIHGVEHTKRDGSKLFGTFILVSFEDQADPILMGRDELGMPKLFADIDITPSKDGVKIALSWHGAVFAKMEVSGLSEAASEIDAGHVNGVSPEAGPTLPPPPPDQGKFVYRYVPAVGEPGKADAAYPVFIPKLERATPPPVLSTRDASVTFDAGDWQSLPTLHHVTKALAEMPIYGVDKAILIKGEGVPDLSTAKRIE